MEKEVQKLVGGGMGGGWVSEVGASGWVAGWERLERLGGGGGEARRQRSWRVEILFMAG